jgi:hypothetical protein
LLRLRRDKPEHFFYEYATSALNDTSIAKLNNEDIAQLAYMPKRDDFEHEYRNEAEKLISRVTMRHQLLNATDEISNFRKGLKFARIHHFNRLLKSRIAKHAILREYQIVEEFFSILKRDEKADVKGIYRVFKEGLFTNKAKEEAYRSVFCRLRQVATKEEMEELTEKTAQIENLKERIATLQELQRQGVTELKGKHKIDKVTSSAKRKKKKLDKNEKRKANLKWQAIKRYNKKRLTQE